MRRVLDLILSFTGSLLLVMWLELKGETKKTRSNTGLITCWFAYLQITRFSRYQSICLFLTGQKRRG